MFFFNFVSIMWSTFCPEERFKYNEEVQQQYCSEYKKNNLRFDIV